MMNQSEHKLESSKYDKWSRANMMMNQVGYVLMVVSPLWRGPGKIHGFVLDEQSLQPGLVTA